MRIHKLVAFMVVLLGLLGLVYADTNGIWHRVEDIQGGGAFGADESFPDLYLDSSQGSFLGIGTATPEDPLHVIGDAKISGILNVSGLNVTNLNVSELCVDGNCIVDLITSVVAGTGLLGGGTSGVVTLDANPTYLQRRVGANCIAGFAIRQIDEDGTVVCEPIPNGDITEVNTPIGSGLTGGGIIGAVTLGIDDTVIQRRVGGGECNGPGLSIKTIYANGSVECEADSAGTGDITSINILTPGFGITGGGLSGDVTVEVDPTVIQRRVNTVCGPTQAMRVIAGSGVATCVNIPQGDITSISGASGISVSGGGGPTPSITADTGYLQRRVGSCGGNEYIRSVNADGSPNCFTDQDSGGDLTAVNAGSGISVSSPNGPVPTVSVNTGVIQARVSDSCGPGNAIRAIDASGTSVTCEPVGTGDVTAVTGGTGISVSSSGGPVPSITATTWDHLTGAQSGNINRGSGNIGFSDATPEERVTVNGNVKATAFLYSSDERLKENVETIDSDVVNDLRAVSFDWKNSGEYDVGFIAQEVEEVVPHIVSEGDDGYKSVDYASLVPYLVAALQEQQKRIEELESKLE